MRNNTSPSIIIGILCLLSFAATAQIGVGVSAGWLNADYRFNTEGSNTEVLRDAPVAGYLVGLVIEREFAKNISFQTEINFKQTGSFRAHNAQTDATSNVTEVVRRNFTSIEVPLLIKYNYSIRRFTVSAIAGPSISYAVRGESGSTFHFYSEDTEYIACGASVPIDFKQAGIRRMDVAGQVGLQLGVRAGFGKIIVDGRYRLGLINMNTNTAENGYLGLDDYKTTTQTYALTAGYVINFGKN